MSQRQWQQLEMALPHAVKLRMKMTRGRGEKMKLRVQPCIALLLTLPQRSTPLSAMSGLVSTSHQSLTSILL